MNKRRRLDGGPEGQTAPISAFAAAKARQEQHRQASDAGQEIQLESAVSDAVELGETSPILKPATVFDDDEVVDQLENGERHFEDRDFSSWRPEKSNVVKSSGDLLHVRLRKRQIVCCVGIYDLKVLKGAAEVHGAVVYEDSSFQPLRVHAASTHPLPLIKCLSEDAEIALVSLKDRKTSLQNLEYLSPLYKRIWHEGADEQNDHVQHKRTFRVLQQASDDSFRRALQILEVPEEWRALIDQPLSPSRRTRTAIVGFRGSGKSQYCQHLINASVSRRKFKRGLILVDLDAQSPMFTTHGQISAIAVDWPIVGPSFSIRVGLKQGMPATLLRSHAVAADCMRDDAAAYLAAARDLFGFSESTLKESALILVKFPDFAPGASGAATMKLLEVLKPTQTVWFARGANKAIDEIGNVVGRESLAILPSMLAQGASRSGDESQDMQILSQFHSRATVGGFNIWDDTPVANVAPTCVSFAAETEDLLAVLCLPDTPPVHLLVDLLNASMVSVVVIEDASYISKLEIRREDSKSIPYLASIAEQKSLYLDPVLTRLVGIALIRGVSTKTQHLQLVMPADVEEAVRECRMAGQHIVLVYGCLDVPRALLAEQAFYDGFANPTRRAPDDSRLVVDALPDASRSSQAPYVEVDRQVEGARRAGTSAWKARRFQAQRS